MDATPAIISDGVLWATTPLFAAAHLWSWHPLWAAGIWTAYGISAFVPQGAALLRPLAESPLRYNFNPLRSPLCGRSPGSVVYEVPGYNNKNGSTTQSTPHGKLRSVSTVNATRIYSQPVLTPYSQWTFASSSSSSTHVITLGIPSKFPDSSEQSAPTNAWVTSTSSTFTMSTQPSTESGFELLEYPTPAVISNRMTSAYLHILKFFNYRLLNSVFDYKIKGRKVRTWMAGAILDGTLLLFLAFPVWCLWKLLRWLVLRQVDEAPAPGAAPPNAPSPRIAAPEIPTPTTSAADPPAADPTRSHTPADWYDGIHQHIRQSARNCTYHWQMFQNALMALKTQINLWAGDLAWLDVPPRMRVAAAVAFCVICMYSALHFLKRALATDLIAWVKWEKDSQIVASASGNTMSLSTSTSVALQTSRNAFTMIGSFLWQIKHCTTFAFQTSMNPDSSHVAFLPPSSWTGALCKWIFHMVMTFKSIPLALSNSRLRAIKCCHDAAWTNPMSLSGIYNPAPHFGPTACLCSAIEYFVMSGRSFKHFAAPRFVPLHPGVVTGRRVLGCLRWISRISGSFYTRWVSPFFHMLTLVLLTAVFTLNTFAIARWRAPRRIDPRLVVGKMAAILIVVKAQHFLSFVPIITFSSLFLRPPSRLMLVKRMVHQACLLFGPWALLVWFLQVTPYRAAENCLFITSTVAILWWSRELVERKWNVLLQLVRIAP